MSKMIVKVVSSTTVRPAATTPQCRMWCSNIDLVAPKKYARIIYFFKWDGSLNFFDSKAMVESLGRTLVTFYPLAGRIGRDDCGRMEVVCNGEGAVFTEAECKTTSIDELGDFAPTPDFMQLVPFVPDHSSADLFNVPVYLIQLTRFKCGGVSLGITNSHELFDGSSATHFLTSWSAVTRGQGIDLPVVFNRSLLAARNPPNPSFTHAEYIRPPPTSPTPQTDTIARIFNLTADQLQLLQSKYPRNCRYSKTTIVAAHVWRCMCIARGLTDDEQITKMFITTNGRARFRPHLPPGYFGNVLFLAVPTATVREVVSGSQANVAAKINAALKQVDDYYMRSVVDYLELQPDVEKLARGPHTFANPDMGLTSWIQLPIHTVNFGWGHAVAAIPVSFWFEGLVFLLASAVANGSISVLIALRPEFMARFQNAMYDFEHEARL